MSTTFYCPIERTSPDALKLPHEQRFFFIEVEASCPIEAMRIQRDEAAAMLGRTGYARWAPVRDECPTFAYMVALSRGLAECRRDKVFAPKARMKIVNAFIAQARQDVHA